MSNNHSNPKIVRRATKGSVVSTTYEFPLDRKKNQLTLCQTIYDENTGKFLGRTPKNWGKKLEISSNFHLCDAIR